MGDGEFSEQRFELVLARVPVLLPQLQHRAQVLLDAQPAEDRGLLRQVADAEPRPLVHRHPGDVVAVDLDPALVDGHEAGDHVETGRLAGAVRAEQPHCLAAPHHQRHAVDHAPRAIGLGDAARDQRAFIAGKLGGVAAPGAWAGAA